MHRVSFGVVLALAASACGPPAPVAAPWRPARAPGTARGPNIVFVLTDDLAVNLLPFMPHVLEMQKRGVTFSHYFVTDSLCCPSRSSIFTGRYPHETGIFTNQSPDGGFAAFRRQGHEQATFATALGGAGYRTALLGKYLNGYAPGSDRPAPGWTRWAVAGNAYREFDYDLNVDGAAHHYGSAPEDYLTDVLSGLAARFVREAPGAFFVEIATFAPHGPYTPAPRDAGALPGLRAPRTPAFDAAPDAAMPRWLAAHPALSEDDVAHIERDYRKRAQSVLSIDKMIGELEAAVAAAGQAENTYFVFSSDNGYHMGEHRLRPGKMTAFDTDIRVPLVITGPGVPAGSTVEEVVENVDLCPTFAELGGVAPPTGASGRSLVPFLRGEKVEGWRTLSLIEHHGPHDGRADPDAPRPRGGNPVTYEAIRARTVVYVEYANGEKEYHDLATDPDELHNTFSGLSGERKAWLHATVDAAAKCRGPASCQAAMRAEVDPAPR